MFTVKGISFKEAGLLSPLVLNYLEKDRSLSSFYHDFPNIQGFGNFIHQKPYSNFNRKQLFEIVSKQSQLVDNVSSSSKENILKLQGARSFTVTTGHQLCLFTGPLYFIYKIISTINLAEQLKVKFPDSDFVPVYWMASEDHDFEEVSSFNLFGKTVKWQSSQTGAVGNFKTHELSLQLAELSEILGQSTQAKELIGLFENAYLKHNSLADATRFLVNELFGDYGIVVVDGNDLAFKEQFKAVFEEDIFQNTPFKCVNETIDDLKKLGHTAQVNPRAINCFYNEGGLRTRIEKREDKFQLVGTDTLFTEKELRNIIHAHPNKISPNVVLRPLYQQTILPNLAYVGGPGELAYWLQFKKMFDELDIEFPLLVPRDFVTVVDKGTKAKIEKLGFASKDIFDSEQNLIQRFQIKSNAVFDIEHEKNVVQDVFALLGDKISIIDKTLAGSVSAELQKSLNSLEMIAGKANKALKQKSETEINQIKAVKQKLFPNAVPQERYDNYSVFYLKYGKAFFTTLKASLNPLILEQKVLVEEG